MAGPAVEAAAGTVPALAAMEVLAGCMALAAEAVVAARHAATGQRAEAASQSWRP
jgi:hypothetical protein